MLAVVCSGFASRVIAFFFCFFFPFLLSKTNKANYSFDTTTRVHYKVIKKYKEMKTQKVEERLRQSKILKTLIVAIIILGAATYLGINCWLLFWWSGGLEIAICVPSAS